MSEPFIGEIRIFAGNFAIRNWAFCNGQLLPIAQNTALFSILGTTYGGDGRTTFGLPNLQGRAPMHAGRGPGLTDRRLGQSGGAVEVTLAAAQLPSHGHRVRASNALAGEATPEGNVLAVAAADVYGPPAAPLREMSNAALAQAGTGITAHNNLQPFLGLNFIIALLGVFPSRG